MILKFIIRVLMIVLLVVAIGVGLTYIGAGDVAAQETEYTISGQFVDENGDPVEGLELKFSGGYTTTTDANGEYSISLPAGENYLVELVNSPYQFDYGENPTGEYYVEEDFISDFNSDLQYDGIVESQEPVLVVDGSYSGYSEVIEVYNYETEQEMTRNLISEDTGTFKYLDTGQVAVYMTPSGNDPDYTEPVCKTVTLEEGGYYTMSLDMAEDTWDCPDIPGVHETTDDTTDDSTDDGADIIVGDGETEDDSGGPFLLLLAIGLGIGLLLLLILAAVGNAVRRRV